MLTIPAAPLGQTRSLEEEFLELVHGDEGLLRAEVDAIIARDWPTGPPPGRPEPRSRGTGPHRPPQRKRAGERTHLEKPRHPHGRLQGRQRSPPRASQGHRPHHSSAR